MFANVTFARFLIGQNMAIAQLAVVHVEIKNQKGVNNMSIYKKGDKYLVEVQVVKDGLRTRKRATADTKRDAIKLESDLKYLISNDLINQGGSMKLKDFLANWLEVKEQQIAQTTFKSYKFNVDRINKKLGGYALEKLKAFHVKQMIDDLRKENYSDNSIKDTYKVLSTAMQDAFIEERIASNFVRKIKPPKVVRAGVVAMTSKDQQRFKDLLATRRDRKFMNFLSNQSYVYFNLALATGMRRGEVGGLKWEDIDFDDSAIILKRNLVDGKDNHITEKLPKNNKFRKIDLDAETLRILSEYKSFIAQFQLKNKLKFVNDIVFPDLDGEFTHPKLWTNRFKNYMKELGIKNQTLHNLRHTHISNLLSIGISLSYVSNRAGHSDISTTARIYAHYMPEQYDGYLQEAMDKLQALQVKNSEL